MAKGSELYDKAAPASMARYERGMTATQAVTSTLSTTSRRTVKGARAGSGPNSDWRIYYSF